MRFFCQLLILCLIAVLLGAGALVWLALGTTPLIEGTAQLSHEDVARAREILRANDPTELPDRATRTITIAERDLNLAVNYVLQKAGPGGARVAILPGAIDVAATLRLRVPAFRPYVNATFVVEDRGDMPYLNDLRIGAVPVPDAIGARVAREVLARAYRTDKFRLASELVKNLTLQQGRVELTYQWRSGMLEQVRSAVLSSAERETLAVYQQRLAALASASAGRRLAITAVLQPLFALALERSTERDPVAENRAVLLVLGSWASGRGLRAIVADGGGMPQRFRVTLDGRYDFAQHFLTSAALVAGGDSVLADAVGLFKEVSDANGGSGFSFTDLAADRAGTRFGALALVSDVAAARLQTLISGGIAEADIMPAAKDLPEKMTEPEFRERFGGVDGVAYRQMVAEIERRISACRLYRD